MSKVLGAGLYIAQCRDCDYVLDARPYICAVEQANLHGLKHGHVCTIVLKCRECGELVEGVCQHARMDRAREREVK